MIKGLIKICPDPHCESIFHNIPKTHTRCINCNGNVIIINEKTYWKKFALNWFQYDFLTGKYLRPEKKIEQLTLF